jgi:transposase
MDAQLQKPERIHFRLARWYCPHCRRNFTPQPPSILPKSLYGTQLIANGVEMYYLHVSEYTEVWGGQPLMDLFKRCASPYEGFVPRLIEEYRRASVKHGD